MEVQFKWECLKKAWNLFVTTGDINSTVIRPVVADSWRRCKGSGRNPYLYKVQSMEPAQIKKELSDNRQLIEISLPVMKNLLSFVEGSGFLISLASSKGMILDLLGDNRVIKKSRVQRGDLWTEETMGTNSVGLCLTTKKPIQIMGSEHFIQICNTWTSSSAPIFNEDQKLIGVLTMTGEWNKVHLHTLGMVVAGVNAIENSLKMKKMYNEVIVSDAYKTAVMESIDEGILALNSDMTISHTNNAAKNILKIMEPTEKIVGQSIKQVIGMDHPLISEIERCLKHYHKEIFLKDKGNFTVSSKLIKDQYANIIGLVLILREMKMVKKMVNRMVGARASFTFNDLVGNNDLFLSAIDLAKTASKSPSNVLVLGESGTGKEMFAQAIHNLSNRSSGPFLAINCAALPRTLIESELFGYAEGAFTGAKKGGNPGKFELADEGTLFLDEIGEMPLEVQAILLRVLQENSIIRIGGKEVIPINARVIAATNKDPVEQIKNGHFREDLFYRLNVLSICIPPLRDRPNDIPTLAKHFLNKLNLKLNKNVIHISPEVLEVLKNHHWPGNIRELQNILERAVNVANNDTIELSDLPDYILGSEQNAMKHAVMPLEKYEKQLIISLMEENKGNRTKVAKTLGISRTTLYRKLYDYKISI
ncbi:sigma 54-interacting transcriptional regulator [Pelotomaculum terephthalicicum JT]|uniref:sigma-54-dependent Fis family transcriptional regulator n=1 Tax=Pelotomaculum terephthalicicum TaxID=206393 RepID=UPI0009CD309B|nr:sigma 54-interacting transcriptional regulator [Pelotomaculum terephthalicicum]MCG9969156.1 sigma 54-interacting transcriptional regulator [Pelotomaculum terephthalicicum JT]OPX88237.1 MAG: Acetoin dehydrogenase operon transcriptional activator AcoR [Pelotomaculum sp. PtaB.Bin104]OPY61275.1 MAG: Acetoin dehydrogenase operon transcriptional activator AcoR [Pelotomaculum sp. PtaU1.Bin065]